AILKGSQMGPGDGWFGPAKSRYGWNWLAQWYDADGDEVITEDEFTGPPELFKRLDRDRDGELQRSEFDWSENSAFVKQQSQAGQWFARIDASSNGRVTPDEWDQFFEKLAGAKGYISRDDLRAALFPAGSTRGAGSPRSQEGPTVDILLKGVLTGELGSLREG